MPTSRTGRKPGLMRSVTRLAGTALLALLIPVVGEVVPAEASTSPMLSVKSTVLVNDGRIDASMLVGSEAAPSLREALSKIPVGFISEPLGTIVLHRNELAQKLGSLAAMFDLPQRVQVLRKGAMLGGDVIGAKVREMCLEGLDQIPPAEIQIDLSRVPHHVVLPAALDEWKLTQLSTNRLGMRLFQLEARCGNEQVRQLIQADVCRVIRAAKMRRLAKRGECVTAADLVETSVRLRNDQPNPPVSLETAVGKQLANIKSPGTMLRESDLAAICPAEASASPATDELRQAMSGPAADPHRESPALPGETGPEPSFLANPRSLPAASAKPAGDLLVKSGDKVEFTVRSGNLNLVVPAKALQNGRAGEAIRLINLQNNRPIKGIITAEGKVEHVTN
ncbi:MAG TPA: flagella basal body P-ring formation protein FlgA [Candidatus Ozemobacteraceae bacterium]